MPRPESPLYDPGDVYFPSSDCETNVTNNWHYPELEVELEMLPEESITNSELRASPLAGTMSDEAITASEFQATSFPETHSEESVTTSELPASPLAITMSNESIAASEFQATSHPETHSEESITTNQLQTTPLAENDLRIVLNQRRSGMVRLAVQKNLDDNNIRITIGNVSRYLTTFGR